MSTPLSALPAQLALPHDGDNGAFDASLESDPETGRVWMAYSSVLGRAGVGKISTRLGYSDDAGATWCDAGLVNAAVDLPEAERPPSLSALPSHWSHEVSALVRDPAAPPDQRWMLVWHRYLHAHDGDPVTEDRQFAIGWIAARSAATPEGLKTAQERKLFSASGYYINPTLQAFNDNVVGPPEHSWAQDPVLGQCLAITELGALAAGGKLYLSFACAAQTGSSVALVALDHGAPSAGWRLVKVVMDQTLAQSVSDANLMGAGPTLTGASASSLFTVGGQPRISISPVGGTNTYLGCWMFDIDLATGDLSGGDAPTLSSVFNHAEGTILSGMCDYDDGASAMGTVFGEAHFAGEQFRLFATGRVP